MDRYENPWRPNYEAGAVGMWLAVGATAWVTADWWDLHAAPFRYLAVTALVMAALWLPGLLRVWRRHHRLRGKPLAFIAPPPGADLPALARKLPHYGKYSYLAFNVTGSQNTVKDL